MSGPLLPDERNRLAYWVGRVLHPYLLPVPTVLVIVRDLDPAAALAWAALVLGVVLLPGIAYVAYLRRQDRHLYQQDTRRPVYLVAWMSVLACLALLLLLDAPQVLIACVVTLAIWLPVQLLINQWVTKISTHMGVLAGCMTALWYLGVLAGGLLPVLVIGLVLLSGWSRVATRHHTLAQVVLGVMVGAGSVLLAFPPLLD